MHDLTEKVPGYRHVIVKRSFPHLMAECRPLRARKALQSRCWPTTFTNTALAFPLRMCPSRL